MHAECEDFLHSTAALTDWWNADVVEVGALDVNGAARRIIASTFISPPSWKWTGVDRVAGPGVDLVGDFVEIARVHAWRDTWDVVVCTEVLEHDSEWRILVNVMLAVLRPGGTLILTCAGTGRPPHAADGSPDGPHPGEYYGNVSLADVLNVIGARAQIVTASECRPPGDTRLIARKV